MNRITTTLASALLLTVSTAFSAPPDAEKELEPRAPVAKTPTAKLVKPDDATGRLIVKFADSLQARAAGNGIRSVANEPVKAINQILQTFGATLKPALGKSEAALRELEARAEEYSGRAQPDLAGMVHVTAPPGVLQNLAQTLNDLPSVEWVQFETELRLMGGGPDCGDPVGTCFTEHGPACDNEQCCETICDIDEFCCNFEWDGICVAEAHLYCEAPPANRCLSGLNGSCYEVHAPGGCVETACCTAVCAVVPFCCENFWADFCVDLAFDLCVPPQPGGPTPLLTEFQGYLRPLSYAAQMDGTPSPLGAPADAFFGFAGEGWALRDDDYPLDPAGNQFDGLYGIGRQLFDVYGVGATNPPGSNDYDDLIANARGKSIKVAVIEWAYFGPEPFTDSNGNGQHDSGEPYSDINGDGVFNANHEDLDVIPEPGQTMIYIPEITGPDHATACLGIINAVENSFGMTGIAPEAEAYFFPITSIEEGPRELAAWTSAMQTLGPGDVISASYGPTPNLNCVQSTWTILRLASDLGITACIAAGNDCLNLDDSPDFGESGAIVVGAGSPGFPYYRLIFSNYHQAGVAGTNGNMVHVQAWGESVAAPGYGTLFYPNGDSWRSYSNSFNGTSAATPQIAGLVACLQGLAKQFYGIPLTPTQIRSVAASGIPQAGVPNPDMLPGFDPSLGCAFDRDQDEGPNKIGPYPVPAGTEGSAASTLLSQESVGFDESPFIDSITVLRGTHLFGTIFSVKASDNSWFFVRARPTEASTSTQTTGIGSDTGSPVGETSTIGEAAGQPIPAPTSYRASGNITDIVVSGSMEGTALPQAMTVRTEMHVSNVSICLMFLEMYNWNANRWEFVDFRFVQALGAMDLCTGVFDGQECTVTHVVPSPQNYLRVPDKRFLARMWTVMPGQSTITAHTVRYDLIDVDAGGFDTPGDPDG